MPILWKRLRWAGIAGLGVMAAGLAAPPVTAGTSLVIRDFVLARDIEQREPVGSTEFYPASAGNAVAFARIWNGGQPVQVRFVWRYGEKVHAVVPVTIGSSPAWRSWSTVDLRPGIWRVALVDSGGTVLAEKTFRVGPDPSAPIAAPAAPAAPEDTISFSRAADPFSSETPAAADRTQ